MFKKKSIGYTLGLVSTVPKLWRDFQGQSQSRVLQGVITAACLLWGKMNEAELSVLITTTSRPSLSALICVSQRISPLRTPFVYAVFSGIAPGKVAGFLDYFYTSYQIKI